MSKTEQEKRFNIGSRQMRTVGTDFSTREDGDDLVIEGYFAVFNSVYEITSFMSESIAPGAFKSSMGRDVRALTNHDTTLVLGRTKANTLKISEDSRGLFGSIRINPKDQDAMNLYERVKRGDVDQCSFGFDVTEEEAEFRDDDSVHWTIKDLVLYEVSCCTFPAYEETSISARSAQRDEMIKRQRAAWKETMLKKLKGESDDAESTAAQV